MQPTEIQTSLSDAIEYWKPTHKKRFIVEVTEVVTNPDVAKDKTPTGKFGKKWELTAVDFTNGLLKLKALEGGKVTTQNTATWTPRFEHIEAIKIIKVVDQGVKQ